MKNVPALGLPVLFEQGGTENRAVGEKNHPRSVRNRVRRGQSIVRRGAQCPFNENLWEIQINQKKKHKVA